MNLRALLIFAALGLGVLGTTYFMGYTTGKGKRVIPDKQSVIMETKPAQRLGGSVIPKRDTLWRDVPNPDIYAIDTLTQQMLAMQGRIDSNYIKGFKDGFYSGWDSASSSHHAYYTAPRWATFDTTAHSKDSVIYSVLGDSFTVFHSGWTGPLTQAWGNSYSPNRQPFLELSYELFFNHAPDNVSLTIRVPKMYHEAFWVPNRIGPAYQPIGRKWGVRASWGLF